MDLQGSSSLLQGGTTIAPVTTSPQISTYQTQPATNVLNYSGSTPTYPVYNATTYDTTATAPAQPTYYYDSAGNAYTDQASATQADQNLAAIQLAQAALNRIPNQLAIADQNIGTQYDQSKQSLDTDAANALSSFNTSSTQNQQDYRTGQNTVNSQASQDNQSLLRILAGLGAGGGSEAKYLIPSLVGNVASKGLSAAAQTFGQNAQGLNTAYGNFQNQDKTERANLENWLSSQNNSAQSTADQNKISLLQTIAGLQTNLSAASPYLSQINDLSSAVDNLAKINPQYAGSLPQYVAPSLSTFVPQGNQPIAIAQQATQPGTPSYLSLLSGLKDKTSPLTA